MTQDIIGRLKYNHNLDVEFIGFTNDKLMIEGEIIENDDKIITITEQDFNLIKYLKLDNKYKDLNKIENKTHSQQLQFDKQAILGWTNINNDYRFDLVLIHYIQVEFLRITLK